MSSPNERRRPQETILDCVVRQHLETFLAQVHASTGTGVLEFGEDGFGAFNECGILAHGFLRARAAGGVFPQAARMSSARLLKRVFDTDLEHRLQCGGAFRIIAAIAEPVGDKWGRLRIAVMPWARPSKAWFLPENPNGHDPRGRSQAAACRTALAAFKRAHPDVHGHAAKQGGNAGPAESLTPCRAGGMVAHGEEVV